MSFSFFPPLSFRCSEGGRRCPVLYPTFSSSGKNGLPCNVSMSRRTISKEASTRRSTSYRRALRTKRIDNDGPVVATPFTFTTRRNNRFGITSDGARTDGARVIPSLRIKKYDDRIYYSTRRMPAGRRRVTIHEETRRARRAAPRRAGCTFVFRRRVSHRERSRFGCCC